MNIAIKLMEAITRKELRFSQNVPLQEYAAFAFEKCSRWFGTPRDSKRPYYLMSFPICFCARSPWRYYLIGLSDKSSTLEQRCYFLGHEMYHRVTMTSAPIHKYWWLDEMMASAVALQLLKEYNMSAFADRCKSELLKLPIEMSFSELPQLKRPRRLLMQSQEEPQGFGAAIARLAIAVRKLVTWDDLCLLVTSDSLEAWFAGLSAEEQPFVRKLFSGDPFGSSEELSDQNAEGYVEFAHALNDLGNEHAAIAALRHALRINPGLAQAHRYIGILLSKTKREDEAIAAWQTALLWDASNPNTYYQLGKTYFLREDYEQASNYLQKALSIDPTHANTKHYLDLLKTKNASP